MKKSIAFFLIVFVIFLSGCSRIKSKSYAKTDDEQGKIITAEERDIDYSGYKDLLSNAIDSFGAYCTYSVYDINNDGVRELILKSGECEAEYAYHFYELDENLFPKEIGVFEGSHSAIYANEDGIGILVVSGAQGYQEVSCISIKNNTIDAKIIIEGEIEADGYL